MDNYYIQLILVIMILILNTKDLGAHGSEPHKSNSAEVSGEKIPQHPTENTENSPSAQLEELYQQINLQYQDKVRPYFKRACYDCHSDQTKYPWYYTIPGINQLIDRDIKEAKVHLVFTETFPFRGHGTPEEDLEEIMESIEEGEMPPFKYRILHKDSKLSAEEKAEIYVWINESLKKLGNTSHSK